MSIAFVDVTTSAIHSTYFPPSLEMLNHIFPHMMNQEPPVTPDGCVDVPIPETITCTDAIKAFQISDTPGFMIVDDEDKLAELRTRALPHIRETRNQLITMCDWRVMPDSPLTPEKRAEWFAYRQALRDLPNIQDVLNPVWPSMPES